MRFLALALALLVGTPALAQDKLTVILDWFINPNHGPLVIAQERGYFADQDLEVEIIAPADPTAPPQIHAQEFIKVVPQANLTLLPGVGHMPHHADPNAAISAIDRAARAARLR